MAYNRKNLLKRIVEIQEIYLKFQTKGMSGTWIHINIIQPNYHITRRTLSSYLSVNARRELREISSDNILNDVINEAKTKFENNK
jgi:hypothetical protein